MSIQKSVSGSGFSAGFWQLGFCLLLTLALAATAALAQTAQTAGTVLGVVRDSTGGTVPDASVTITNVETGQSRAVSTGPDGAYRAPGLRTGRYRVRIEKTGFKAVTQQGLVLNVAEELVVNAALEIGSLEQEIVVTGEVPVVNTTTTSLGGLVSEEKMSELPLNGRNYIDLTLLQPGVSLQANHGTGGGQTGTWFSSNGAPQYSNYVTIDGASMVNMMGGSTSSEAGTTLGVDGIREYKIITNTFSAEYGVTMGSQMVVVSKGGTNNWHGDLFEYLRNDHLDARNFFDTEASAGKTMSGAQRRLPVFTRNNFGASGGGPIKKDKTFFYAVYEGLRQKQGFTAFDNVLPASCHSIQPASGGNYQFTSDAAAKGCASTLVGPGGTGTSTVIPGAMVNFLGVYPLPNLQPGNHYTFATSNQVGVNFGQIRVDHNFSPSDSFFSRYTIDDGLMQNAPLTTSPLSIGTALPGFRLQAPSRNQFLTIAENHVFSPAVLNTARLSFSRTGWDVANIEPPNLNGPGYTMVAGRPMGTITIPGFTGIGPGITYASPGESFYHIQNLYTLSDDLFWTHGKHALKFGALINRYNQGLVSFLFAQGQASFTSAATFMTGIYNSITSQDPASDVNRYFIYNTYGFYAQDDLRATSRLTLNMGLRYEVETTPYELNNKGYAIRDLTQASSSPQQPTQGPVIQTPQRHNFSPRVGFALDPQGNGKTAIRGGFGVYYDVGNIGAPLLQQVYTAPPVSTTSFQSNPGGQVLPLGPNGFIYNAGTGSKSLHTTDYLARQPYLVQWNMTVEHQFPGSTGLAVSYVGTRGIHLWTAQEGNPTIPTANVNGALYWSTQVPTCGNIGTVVNGQTMFCRFNPIWASAIVHMTNGDSNYNALQVAVTKRLSRGLQYQASYTWSHSIDDTEGAMYSSDCSSASGMAWGAGPWSTRYDRGPSCFDIRQNLRFNLLYHLPNVKSSGFASKFLNGWWMGNIISMQSGYAFSPITAANRSQSAVLGAQFERVNLGTATVAPGQTGPGGFVNTTNSTFIPYNPDTVNTGDPNHWFNPLMFALQPMVPCPNNSALTCGQLGNASRGILRGPGMATWDLSLVKDTKLGFLGESGNLEFRAEFFNLLNRANFGMPNGTVFPGTTATPGAYAALQNAGADPLGTVGQITTTATNSRQIQFALKIIF